jgi:hypothetical protein
MRHSAIATTFNVYGKALSPEKREANRKVVEMLLKENSVGAAEHSDHASTCRECS